LTSALPIGGGREPLGGWISIRNNKITHKGNFISRFPKFDLKHGGENPSPPLLFRTLLCIAAP
jgi:hypothetical protein